MVAVGKRLRPLPDTPRYANTSAAVVGVSATEPCDRCGDPVENALARTVRLSVDRSQIDAQRLCPDCFAAWIDRYDEEMRAASRTASAAGDPDADDSDIIVD